MTATDYDDLRRLAEAASPGPWTYSFRGYCIDVYQSGGEHLATLHWGEPSLLHEQREADAIFIAAANPAVILALLEERDRLAAELELWKPLTPAEAEAALNAAQAAPLPEERIAEIVAKATDPGESLPNSEQAQLAARVKELEQKLKQLEAESALLGPTRWVDPDAFDS